MKSTQPRLTFHNEHIVFYLKKTSYKFRPDIIILGQIQNNGEELKKREKNRKK